MIRAIATPGDIPRPNQPSAVGEFFFTAEGYLCAKCNQHAKLVVAPGECGVRCTNPDCPQRDYLYEPLRVWLPRAKPQPGPEPD